MNHRGWLIGLAILVLVVLLTPILVGAMVGPGVGMGPSMMWGYGPSGVPAGMAGWRWGLGMGIGWLGMAAFWGLLIAGVALVIRALGRPSAAGRPAEPLEIARRRYAAGEITRDEYEQLRKDLAA